jgi:hypothetical protein
MNRTIVINLVMFAAAGFAGCNSNSSATVGGQVTLNGRPLAKGIINFSAADAVGGTGGGEIASGSYEVKNLKPGKYQVHIAGVPEGKIIMPGDPQAQRTMTTAEIQALTDPLPPDVTGRDQTIEVAAGRQTHDFKLESKSKQ